jgi:hypothetical protein
MRDFILRWLATLIALPIIAGIAWISVILFALAMDGSYWGIAGVVIWVVTLITSITYAFDNS